MGVGEQILALEKGERVTTESKSRGEIGCSGMTADVSTIEYLADDCW